MFYISRLTTFQIRDPEITGRKRFAPVFHRCGPEARTLPPSGPHFCLAISNNQRALLLPMRGIDPTEPSVVALQTVARGVPNKSAMAAEAQICRCVWAFVAPTRR